MDIEEKFKQHRHNGIDNKRIKFSELEITKNAAITAPSGGATVDSQARAAINSLITELENRGFINPN